MSFTPEELAIIASAEARAHAEVVVAINQLRQTAHLELEWKDDWFEDGRHRIKPQRAISLGLLAHLEGNQ